MANLSGGESLISKKDWTEQMSFAAILVGPIQYTEIPQGAAFFDDYWNVMNAQHKTE